MSRSRNLLPPLPSHNFSGRRPICGITAPIRVSEFDGELYQRKPTTTDRQSVVRPPCEPCCWRYSAKISWPLLILRAAPPPKLYPISFWLSFRKSPLRGRLRLKHGPH